METTKVEITEKEYYHQVDIADTQVGDYVKIVSNVAGTPIPPDGKFGIIVKLPEVIEDQEQGLGYCILAGSEVGYVINLDDFDSNVIIIPTVNISYGL